MDQIEEYINRQASPQQEICQKLRALIKATLPHAREEMKWGVPSYNEGRYYFVALKGHVNLGFSIRGLKKEELLLFDGGGKTTRHIEIHSINDLDEERIVQLLHLIDQAK